MTGRLLFVFVDGVGIGPDDDGLNPFLRAELPTFRAALGGLPVLARPSVEGPLARAYGVDALLDTPGTPQSGTGQTSLLTGRNAATEFGRHFGPWVPVALRPLLEKHNLLIRARSGGVRVTFANAYPEGFLERYPRRIAAPPLAADSAGLMVRHLDDLMAGRAVASEIVNTGWRRRLGHTALPEIGPVEAGGNLAAIANDHDLTFFAHYSTDTAGHRGGMSGAVAALERLDGFLKGVLDGIDDDVTLFMTSDHGNIEDASGGHTRNPALALEAGPGLHAPPDSILDVAAAILGHLGLP